MIAERSSSPLSEDNGRGGRGQGALKLFRGQRFPRGRRRANFSKMRQGDGKPDNVGDKIDLTLMVIEKARRQIAEYVKRRSRVEDVRRAPLEKEEEGSVDHGDESSTEDDGRRLGGSMSTSTRTIKGYSTTHILFGRSLDARPSRARRILPRAQRVLLLRVRQRERHRLRV